MQTEEDSSFDTDVTMPGRRADAGTGTSVGQFREGYMILGRYAVLSQLGRGGMGVVYRCMDTVGGVEVAVKGLPPEVSHDSDSMEDIRENFQLVSALRHQAIVGIRTLEADKSTGDFYLVMDLASGMSLHRWLKRRSGPEFFEKKLSVLAEVASALDYAHGQKIMHRDIKPENVMIDAEDHPHVLDFGLASQIRTSMSRVSMLPRSMSGTPTYKSPEQWRGHPQYATSDQYALGVMAYEMIAGYLPFDNDDVNMLRMAVLNEAVPAVPDVPSHVNAALARALSKNPDERFATCSDFVTALAGGKVGDRKPLARSVGSAASAGRRRSVAPGLLLAACAVAVVAGVVFFKVPTGKQEEADRLREDLQQQEIVARNESARIEALRKVAADMQTRATSACEDARQRGYDRIDGLRDEYERLQRNFRYGESAMAPERSDYVAATNCYDQVRISMLKMVEAKKKIDAAEAEKRRQEQLAEDARRRADEERQQAEQRRQQAERERQLAEQRRRAALDEKLRMGYVVRTNDDGTQEAAWMPGRLLDGGMRRTGSVEGSYERLVDCTAYGCVSGQVRENSRCQACGGQGQRRTDVSCSLCGGSGSRPASGRCSSCNGSGSRVVDCVEPGFGPISYAATGVVHTPHGVLCSNCSGKGTIVNPVAAAANIISLFGNKRNRMPQQNTQMPCTKCGGTGFFRHDRCNGTGKVRENCSKCSGTGTVSGSVSCSACSGRGTRSATARCSSCDGVGTISRSSDCQTCGGKGRVWRLEGAL